MHVAPTGPASMSRSLSVAWENGPVGDKASIGIFCPFAAGRHRRLVCGPLGRVTPGGATALHASACRRPTSRKRGVWAMPLNVLPEELQFVGAAISRERIDGTSLPVLRRAACQKPECKHCAGDRRLFENYCKFLNDLD